MSDIRQAQMMVNQALSLFADKVKASQANAMDEIRSMKIDLSQGRTKDQALKVSFPFKNVRIEEASDVSTWIRLIPENNDQGRGDTILRLKDNFKSEFGFSCAYLYWDAQPNKEVVLKFYTTSTIENGSLLLDQNNALNTLNVGRVTIDNDELAVESDSIFVGLGGLPAISMQYFSINEIHNRYQQFPPSWGFGPKYFVVPKGYVLQILSWEIKVYTAPVMSSSSFDIQIRSAPYNSSWDSSSTLTSTNLVACLPSKVQLASDFTVGTVYKEMSFYNSVYDGVLDFKYGLVDEDHIVWVHPVKQGTVTAGNMTIKILGRLIKKVG